MAGVVMPLTRADIEFLDIGYQVRDMRSFLHYEAGAKEELTRAQMIVRLAEQMQKLATRQSELRTYIEALGRDFDECLRRMTVLVDLEVKRHGVDPSTAKAGA